MTRTIVHLVDELTAGGVTRFVDYLIDWPELKTDFHHQRLLIRRGQWSAPVLDADLIVSHLSVSWKNLPMFLALRAKNPRTSMIHVEHTYSESFMDRHVRSTGRFMTLLRTVYALFEHTVAVSHAQLAWMTKNDLVRHGRASSIHPLTDLSPFLSLPPAERPARNIAAIGRLEEEKGLDTLIQAFRTAAPHGATLSIFGTGSLQPDLMQIAGQDPRITFFGHADPVVALTRAEIVALPSRRETFGLVALEARAAGRTVLVSGADGLADQVDDGATLVGPALSDWYRAMANLDTLHDVDQLQTARLQARDSAYRARQAWVSLFDAFAAPQMMKLAS